MALSRDTLAELIHGNVQYIQPQGMYVLDANSFTLAVADYLGALPMTCSQVHPSQDVYHPHGHTFNRDAWIATYYGTKHDDSGLCTCRACLQAEAEYRT